jgi:DNA invertase Pin-like site-specific DNA recombinase
MKLIAYYRVSTKRQGQSGLGLDAQQSAVSKHVAASGGTLLGAFTEVESGKKSNRPQLAKALAECKRTGSVLVVAKLDRLSRNVAFTAALLDSKIEFVCCDNPTANKLTIHILAALAQAEAEAISQRTRVALAALKKRGVTLGGPSLSTARQASAVVRGQMAATYRAEVKPVAEALRGRGYSLQQIADTLTAREIRTPRGGRQTPCSVARLLA